MKTDEASVRLVVGVKATRTVGWRERKKSRERKGKWEREKEKPGWKSEKGVAWRFRDWNDDTGRYEKDIEAVCIYKAEYRFPLTNWSINREILVSDMTSKKIYPGISSYTRKKENVDKNSLQLDISNSFSTIPWYSIHCDLFIFINIKNTAYS